MTVSMRVMSAGDGYKYLLKTIAAADGDRSLSTPLTRYYAEAGTPPGRWLGAGVTALGRGELSVGDRVIVTRVTDEPHEDPAIGSFLALLEKDIQSGQHITTLPDELARSMLAALGKRVDLNEDIEGDVAL